MNTCRLSTACQSKQLLKYATSCKAKYVNIPGKISCEFRSAVDCNKPCLFLTDVRMLLKIDNDLYFVVLWNLLYMSSTESNSRLLTRALKCMKTDLMVLKMRKTIIKSIYSTSQELCSQSTLYHGLIPAWISNYTHCELWGEIIHPIPNSGPKLQWLRRWSFGLDK